MKKHFLAIVLFAAVLSGYSQTETGLTWYSDLAEAQQASTASKKPIFAFFTGSDWCGWCHKLQRDVLTKKEFIDWAQSHVVLLELDFPRSKQLPPELVQQNQSLQQFFKVTGFPTIWLFNAEIDQANKRFTINPYGSLGYPGGAIQGKEEVAFIDNANAILSKVTN